MTRQWLILPALLFISACTQEHLILTKNISKAELISVDQILLESGLKAPQAIKNKKETKNTTKPVQKKKIVKKQNKIKSSSISLKIPRQEEFSINLDSRNLFIVLKSISGDLKFLADKSNPDKGFFLFRMGDNNSQVNFHIYDLSGVLRQKTDYQIHALNALQKNSVTNTNDTLLIDNTKKTQPDNALESTGIAQTILRTLEGKNIREKISTLEKSTQEAEIPSIDKQLLLAELIQLYISEYSFKKAKDTISQIQDKDRSDFLNGLYYHKKRDYNLALQYYIKTLDSNPAFKQEFLPNMIDLMIHLGSVELKIIDKLEEVNITLEKDDPENFAKNQIGIAQIYGQNAEIKKAEKILKNIIEGEYSFSIIQTAENSLKVLEDEFLDYR